MDPTPARAARTASLLLTVLLWITAIGALGQIASRLLGGPLDFPLVVTLPMHVPSEAVPLRERFEIAGPLPVNIDLVDPTLLQRLIVVVPPLVWSALAFVVLWLLRRVARSTVSGEPFGASNVARLRWVGAIFLIGYPLATVVRGVFSDLLSSPGVWTGGRLPGEIATSFPVLSAPAILAAIGFFALAEVFAHGAELREDVDATI